MAKVTELKIVKEIMAAFNLGEEGKVGSFFNGLVKSINSDIAKLKQNIEVAKLEYAGKLREAEDSIEDAKAYLESVYTDIDLEKIQTREQQRAYEATYMKAISSAEFDLSMAEDNLKGLKNSHEDDIKDLNKRIEAAEARLTRITSK